jgi:hypothetical protein
LLFCLVVQLTRHVCAFEGMLTDIAMGRDLIHCSTSAARHPTELAETDRAFRGGISSFEKAASLRSPEACEGRTYIISCVRLIRRTFNAKIVRRAEFRRYERFCRVRIQPCVAGSRADPVPPEPNSDGMQRFPRFAPHCTRYERRLGTNGRQFPQQVYVL